LCFTAFSSHIDRYNFYKSSSSNSFLVFIVCFIVTAQVFIFILYFNFLIMNIYVSNLSFNTSDVELQDLFSKYGEVSSAKVITDRETGRSRGFGFVEMANDAEGKAAMEGLNNKEVEGRAMSVSVAKEREARTGGGGYGGGNRGGGYGGGGNRGGGGSRW
jgi:RNA recognition motif-containing protein